MLRENLKPQSCLKRHDLFSILNIRDRYIYRFTKGGKWKRRRKYEEHNFTQLEQFRKSSAEYRLYQKITNDQ